MCIILDILFFLPLAQWSLLLFCMFFAFVEWFSHCSHIIPHLNFFVCLLMVLLVAAFISTAGKKNCNFLSRKNPSFFASDSTVKSLALLPWKCLDFCLLLS